MFCYFFYHMVSNGISVWEITSLQWCVGGWLARGLTQAIQSLKKARITFIWGGGRYCGIKDGRSGWCERGMRLIHKVNAIWLSRAQIINAQAIAHALHSCNLFMKKNYENKVYASNWFSNKQTKTKNKRRKKNKYESNLCCVC